MWREVEPEDLIACHALEENRPLVANKRGPTRLGVALMLRFFELEARFPRPARRHLHQRHVGERGVANRLDVVADATPS